MERYVNFNDTHYEITIDNMKIQIEQFNRGTFLKPCSRHRHGKNFYEAHLIHSGLGTLVTDDGEFPLKTGTLYMTGPGIAHAQLTDERLPMTEYCLGMNVRRTEGSKNSDLSGVFLRTAFWYGSDTNEECLNLFRLIEKEHAAKSIGYVNNIKNHISSIIVQLVRCYTDSAKSAAAPPPMPEYQRMNFIDKCFLNGYATVTEEDLADGLGLSVRQVQRFLKEHYGKTFSQMRREARLNKARELMKQGLSADDAAEAVGYTDTKAFLSALKSL